MRGKNQNKFQLFVAAGVAVVVVTMETWHELAWE